MFPNKHTAWCGLAAVFLLGSCGSGADSVADDAATPAAVAVETETDQAPASGEAADETEVSPAATASTVPPMTLPAPSADGDASAAPDNGNDGATSSSLSPTTSVTEPNETTTQPPATAPTTAAPTTAAPTTQAPTTAPPAANLFPDVSVVNVADRQTVSMAARLGGGDRPILLWFWTPF